MQHLLELKHLSLLTQYFFYYLCMYLVHSASFCGTSSIAYMLLSRTTVRTTLVYLVSA